MLNVITLAAQSLDGQPLAEGLRDFFGPLFLVILAICAIFAICRHKITVIFELVGIGIVVAILLWQPDVIVGMGEIIADLLPGS
jgi:amino acid permease